MSAQQNTKYQPPARRDREGGFRGGDREGGFRGGDREGGFRGGDRGGFGGGREREGDREGDRGGSWREKTLRENRPRREEQGTGESSDGWKTMRK